MKKSILILLILVTATISAYSSFIQFGPTGTIDNVDIRCEDVLDDLKHLGNRIGAEGRINILHVAAHVSAFYIPATATQDKLFNTSLYTIVNFDINDTLSFGFGPGLNYDLDIKALPEDYKEVILNSNFEFKTHVTYQIDDSAISAYYVLPSNYVFAGGMPKDGVIAWNNGYIGLSLLLGF